LMVISNLGWLLLTQGRLDEAGALYREALEGQRRKLGDEHPNTQQSIRNLAITYSAQGKYDEAEPLCREALDVLRRTKGNDDPNTLEVKQFLEMILKKKQEADSPPPVPPSADTEGDHQ